MTLGEEIQRRREDLGMTQTQLAEASGVGQGRISEYERGARLPTIESLQALAKVLGPFEIRAVETKPAESPWRDHYRTMFADVGGVGVQLLGRVVFRIRHGSEARTSEDRREVRDIVLGLRDQYGDTVEREDALRVVETS